MRPLVRTKAEASSRWPAVWLDRAFTKAMAQVSRGRRSSYRLESLLDPLVDGAATFVFGFSFFGLRASLLDRT
ncbi:MAG: hypothetical protein ACXW2T_10135 [Allosphingosinicella sp.]